MILHIFGVREQRGGGRGTICERQALQRGGECEADETRRVGARKIGEFRKCARTVLGTIIHRQVVGERADGGDANVFVGVAEAFAQPRFIRGTNAVERPERAEAMRDVAVFGEKFLQRRGE